jgi:hypothetical protein
MMFSVWSAKQQLNRERVFCAVHAAGQLEELVVRQLWAGMNMSMEAEDNVGICYRAMTPEDEENWEKT